MADTEVAPVTESVTLDQVLAEREERREEETTEVETEGPEEAASEEEIAEADDPSAEADVESEPEGVDADDETEDEQEPETAIQAPQFWGAEDKQAFAELSPEAQELVLKVDQQREQAVRQKIQETAQARKAAEARQQTLEQRIDGLSEFMSERQAALKQYDDVDWVNEFAAAAGDPQALANVQAHQAQYQRLKAEVEKAEKAMTEAEAADLQESRRRLVEELPQRIPQLANPETAPKYYEDLVRYAFERKAVTSVEDFELSDPVHIEILNKAMLYDKGQARAKEPITKPKPKAKPTVKPAAAVARGAPQSKRMRALMSKKELTIDESVELRGLKRAAGKA